ncbi:helix-turn-helix domain-containing protein [Rhodoferax ferrireducens]|uniref:helix-turn-helix domain-containing protein n=1 Tax=Rhodoferax ferrireducens TaxID=192843 RepID=UPI000E0D0066|nr:helix-turn-helix domain-containing protein [Rhodoferax ferrireducens]
MTNMTLPQGTLEAGGLNQWNDLVGNVFGDIAVDAPARGFHASIKHQAWGTLAMSTVDSTPARVEGGTRCAGPRERARGGFLLLNVLGHTTVSQDGRQAVLGPGDLTVVRQGEFYCIEFDEVHRMQVLALPELDDRSAFDEHVARGHPGREAPLLGAFMTQLAGMNDSLAPSLDGNAGVRLALDLLAFSWPRRGGDALVDHGALEKWERLLMACIERELCDPDLDAHALGRTLGISARYVQMVLARRGTTLTAYLQERRLQRAAQRLRASDAARIGDIALEIGFNDLSHFCRCFRRRFGCSARDWRQGH